MSCSLFKLLLHKSSQKIVNSAPITGELVVRRFVQAVSEQVVGVGSICGVRPDQQLVKV